MGQFDTKTDAALAQLNYDELHKTPGGEFAELIGDLLALVGTASPLGIVGGISTLLLKVRKLAGASYASNLIYAITAVRDDLAALYGRYEDLRSRIESLPNDPKFAEAISALALHAMHTSVRERLRRLSLIVVNGVKEDDLDTENLDDMMRAAVELKNADIVLLGKLYKLQKALIEQQRTGEAPFKWHQDIQSRWMEFINSGEQNPQEHLSYRSSFSRLESVGFIKWISAAGNYGVGNEIYALLIEGKIFYERLQEIVQQ